MQAITVRGPGHFRHRVRTPGAGPARILAATSALVTSSALAETGHERGQLGGDVHRPRPEVGQ